ncbi:MAG: glycosyltransferase [Bacteroidota bacterium]
MQKIALLEPYHHSEVVRTFGKLLLASGCDVDVFASASVREDCSDLVGESLCWHLLERAEDWKGLDASLAGFDLLIFVTLQPKDTYILSWRTSARKLLLMHNGHRFLGAWGRLAVFQERKQLLPNLLRAIRWWMVGTARKANQLLHFVDAICFPNESVRAFMLQQYPSLAQFVQVLPSLPFAFYEGEKKRIADEKIKVVIPGSVRNYARNYEMALEAFEQLDVSLQAKVQLVFLGQAIGDYAEALIAQARKMSLELVSFGSKVPQTTYDAHLASADFLLLPIQKSYRLGAVVEEFGRSNITGAENDLLRFGLPALVSQHYPLPKELEPLVRRFDSTKALSQLLQAWVRQRSFERIRQDMKAHMNAFGLAAAQRKMMDSLSALAPKVS